MIIKLINLLSIVGSFIMMIVSLYYSYTNGIIFFWILELLLLIEHHIDRIIEAIESKSD